MKILVTGGAGFIGSHVVERYLAEGHEVAVIDDLSSGDERNLSKNIRLYRQKIEGTEIDDILARERPEVVNHHAAQVDVRGSVTNPGKDALVNVLGTLNLLEACRRHGVKKVVFSSSGGAIYGEQESFPADESHPTQPRSPYGVAKLAVEKYLQYYRWTHGIEFVTLRYANVYGPRQSSRGEAGVIAVFTDRMLKGEAIVVNGDGLQTRDYVFVDDVVSCNVRALQDQYSGFFNVGTGSETDVNTIALKIGGILGSLPKTTHGEAKMGETRRSCLKPGAIQTSESTGLNEGLKKTVGWFRNQSG